VGELQEGEEEGGNEEEEEGEVERGAMRLCIVLFHGREERMNDGSGSTKEERCNCSSPKEGNDDENEEERRRRPANRIRDERGEQKAFGLSLGSAGDNKKRAALQEERHSRCIHPPVVTMVVRDVSGERRG
jgi:hypothetical protein